MLWCDSTFKAPSPMLPASITLTPFARRSAAMLLLQPHPFGDGNISEPTIWSLLSTEKIVYDSQWPKWLSTSFPFVGNAIFNILLLFNCFTLRALSIRKGRKVKFLCVLFLCGLCVILYFLLLTTNS